MTDSAPGRSAPEPLWVTAVVLAVAVAVGTAAGGLALRAMGEKGRDPGAREPEGEEAQFDLHLKALLDGLDARENARDMARARVMVRAQAIAEKRAALRDLQGTLEKARKLGVPVLVETTEKAIAEVEADLADLER